MSLSVFPPNKTIEDTLNSFYPFKKECEYSLVISYKTSITCNSNQNADKKAYGFPQSYLRMELKYGAYLQYTYYKDLQDNLSAKDVQNGFEKMKEELQF